MAGSIDMFPSDIINVDDCKTCGCKRAAMPKGHFQDKRDIGYCLVCCRERANMRRHCGVCQEDFSDFRVYGNTCMEHTGYTLRDCANPECAHSHFYRHRECKRIDYFAYLPDNYSNRGDDYCDNCLPEIIKMNKRNHQNTIDHEEFLNKYRSRNARLHAMAICADPVKSEYHPNLVVDIRFLLIISINDTISQIEVTHTKPLPYSVTESDYINKEIGSISVCNLPAKYLKYDASHIQGTVKRCITVSALVRNIGSITLN
jgi:hypothetical protein